MSLRKPSMFIGSSVEGKRIAETIQMMFDYDVQCTVWTQGAFGLSGGTLESLVATLDEYDFATLVLTANDLLEKRNTGGRAARDNVLFELGLFMGALGRERTFIVHSRTTAPMLPSDLAGITPATYEERSNLEAALNPACMRIRTAIENQGIRPRLAHTDTKDSEISKFNEMLSEQNDVTTNNMDFLAGAWISTPPGSHVYCHVTQGIPRIVYCYTGNLRATGEFYDLKRIGDEIVGRFRWFDAGIKGFAWLRIDSPMLISGAWCLEQIVPEGAYDNPELLRQSAGMISFVWRKQADVTFPGWALRVLNQFR